MAKDEKIDAEIVDSATIHMNTTVGKDKSTKSDDPRVLGCENHLDGYENTISIDSGNSPIDSVASVSIQGNDVSVIQTSEHVYPVEVTAEYSFTVDSKGLVKPEFKGIIHRRLTVGSMLFGGDNYPHTLIKKDTEFLVAYAQEVLDKTPKTIEDLEKLTKKK